MNFLEATAAASDGSSVELTLAAAPASPTRIGVRAAVAAGARLHVGVRPEHVRLDPIGEPAIELSAIVERLEQLGGISFLYGRLPSGEGLTVQVPGPLAQRAGESIAVRLPVAALHVFEATDDAGALTQH